MYIERNVFQLKFGSSKQAITLWQDYLAIAHKTDNGIHARLLTDLTGQGYSLVLELVYEDYSDLDPSKCRLTLLEGWKDFYNDFIPLCENTERTLYKIQTAF